MFKSILNTDTLRVQFSENTEIHDGPHQEIDSHAHSGKQEIGTDKICDWVFFFLRPQHINDIDLEGILIVRDRVNSKDNEFEIELIGVD